ncbi:MAG: heme exporter protein CcmB, partial [Pseudomonadota bacterium]
MSRALTVFSAVFMRELRLSLRQGGGGPAALAFFLAAAGLAPLGLGPEASVLRPAAPGVVWLAALLAVAAGLERLFQDDLEAGEMDLLAAADAPLELIAAAKAAAFHIATIGPIALAAAPVGLAYRMTDGAALVLAVGVAIGGLGLAFIGAAAAALTAGVRRGGVLIAVIAAPLAAPALVFGAASARLADQG